MRKRSNRFMPAAALILYLVLLFPSCGDADVGSPAQAPLNIILMIGDGMGVSQITADRTVEGRLNIERMTTVGLQSTRPASGLITDSAASMTAMATGVKTVNGAISVGVDGSRLRTVLEAAEEKGMLTGLVATSSITHATPAALASHVRDRGMYAEIAWQISRSGVDLIIGGGMGWFLPGSEEGSLRDDDRDPMAELEARMAVAGPEDAVSALGGDSCNAVFIHLDHPPGAADRPVGLGEMTARAIGTLSRGEEGFFLMVEGSQIDWAAHEQDLEGMLAELKDFNEAVGKALDFAEADENTLVIVTGDHETGGFAIHDGSFDDHVITSSGWTTDHHTGAMIPVFASGPGERLFTGIFENSSIGSTLIALVEGKAR